MTAEITKSTLLPDSPDFLQHLSSIISLLATALCGGELWQRALEPSPKAKCIVTLPLKMIILNTSHLKGGAGGKQVSVKAEPSNKYKLGELFLYLDYAFNGISKPIYLFFFFFFFKPELGCVILPLFR